jgi:diacylglycerol kinase (ATP)
MKKAKIIYNPYSGDKSFKQKLDLVTDKLQTGGYEVTFNRTTSLENIYESVRTSKGYDTIITSGGDGTINHVVNAMILNNIHIPLGIFPSGTSNDFALHLKIPKNVADACKIIINGNIKELYLGKINERYFVNVAAGGLLTDISQKIDINMKNTLGKMAYYLKGIEKLPDFRSIPITVKYKGSTIKENVFLFVILNGSTAGGFKLAPDSSADANTLNFIGIKTCNIIDLFNLFIKMLRGEHLEDTNVIYFQGNEFLIECKEDIETDIDGETGPQFPLNIRLSSKKLKVFTP